jgi:hypothetical protein
MNSIYKRMKDAAASSPLFTPPPTALSKRRAAERANSKLDPPSGTSQIWLVFVGIVAILCIAAFAFWYFGCVNDPLPICPQSPANEPQPTNPYNFVISEGTFYIDSNNTLSTKETPNTVTALPIETPKQIPGSILPISTKLPAQAVPIHVEPIETDPLSDDTDESLDDEKDPTWETENVEETKKLVSPPKSVTPQPTAVAAPSTDKSVTPQPTAEAAPSTDKSVTPQPTAKAAPSIDKSQDRLQARSLFTPSTQQQQQRQHQQRTREYPNGLPEGKQNPFRERELGLLAENRLLIPKEAVIVTKRYNGTAFIVTSSLPKPESRLLIQYGQNTSPESLQQAIGEPGVLVLTIEQPIEPKFWELVWMDA